MNSEHTYEGTPESLAMCLALPATVTRLLSWMPLRNGRVLALSWTVNAPAVCAGPFYTTANSKSFGKTFELPLGSGLWQLPRVPTDPVVVRGESFYVSLENKGEHAARVSLTLWLQYAKEART